MSGGRLRYYITQDNVFLSKNTKTTTTTNNNSTLNEEVDQEGNYPSKNNETIKAKVKKNRNVDEDEGESLQEFIYEQTNKFFVDNIPIESIKDLPNTYLYFFGTVAHLVALFFFCYFVYDNYTQSISQAYISLSTQGGDCETVPINITGSYYADYYGNWAGTPQYEESKAIYEVSLNNFQISSNAQYEQMMETFYTDLVQVGQLAETYNLAENLIYWMTYILYYDLSQPDLTTNFSAIGYGQLQTLQLTGDASIVFNLQNSLQRFGSSEAICNAQSYTIYDQANHMYRTYYENVTEFYVNPNCSAAVIPSTFGYVTITDGNIFNVDLHVQGLAVALGVNLGIIPFNSLRVISKKVGSFNYGNVEYLLGEYFDIRYPLMEPLFCIQNLTVLPERQSGLQQLCFTLVGATFALPVFNQYGANLKEPLYCDCTNPLLQHSLVCSQFNLFTGLLFYKTSTAVNMTQLTLKGLVFQLQTNVTLVLKEMGLFNLLATLYAYPNYRSFNKAAYNASFWTINADGDCDTECRKNAFAFCQLANSNNTCSLTIVASETDLLNSVSEYKYQLNNASCTNSMVISPKNWEKLVSNPPVQFTQIYYECYQPNIAAFVAAIGIANGNTQIFIPIFVFGLLPFLYFILVAIRQVPPKEEYTKLERKQANEILSLLLLRLRDGKTRGIKKNGVLQNLAKELIAAAKEEGGYPDSDDEDDESDQNDHHHPHQERKGNGMIFRDDSLISVDEAQRAESFAGRDSVRKGPRPSSSGHRVRYVPKHKARLKMRIFTKQLKGKYIEEDDLSSSDVRSSTAQTGLTRNDTVMEGRETELTPRGASELFTRKTTTLERTQTNMTDLSSPNPIANKRKSSMFSYFFGGGGGEEINSTDPTFIPRIKGRRILDAETDPIPSAIQVLNQFEEDMYDIKKKLTQQELDILLEDLLRYFNEAISQAKYRTEDSNNPLFISSAIDQLNRDSVDAGIPSSLHTNRDIPAFKQAKELTKRLVRVNFQELYKREDVETYIKLSNILCMHASIELECEMKAIATQFAKRIAYNIGGKILTADDLNHIL